MSGGYKAVQRVHVPLTNPPPTRFFYHTSSHDSRSFLIKWWHNRLPLLSFAPSGAPIRQSNHEILLIRAILTLLEFLLPSMGRTKMDAAQAQRACDAVRGGILIRAATINRLSGNLGIYDMHPRPACAFFLAGVPCHRIHIPTTKGRFVGM